MPLRVELQIGLNSLQRVIWMRTLECQASDIELVCFSRIDPKATTSRWLLRSSGSRRQLASRFAFRRVRLANADGIPLEEHEPLWLLMEWPFGESEPSQFAVTTLSAKMSKKQIVRRYKERYRTEQAYEEMKGELGLDHFEGRTFRGWHRSCIGRSLLLCLRRDRARSVFFPLG